MAGGLLVKNTLAATSTCRLCAAKAVATQALAMTAAISASNLRTAVVVADLPAQAEEEIAARLPHDRQGHGCAVSTAA